MTYISGFLLAVPTANKEAYAKMSRDTWAVFEAHGCRAVRETWGVDVPDGKVTSFPMAVRKTADETVVFSWMEWPDRETCDRAWAAVMADPRMAETGDMPFDGARMMWGGFEMLLSLDAAGADAAGTAG